MLKFKTIFKNHKIVLLVDNARTHTAKKFDKNQLFKKAGTNCPYEFMEWEKNGVTNRFEFFDENGESKGLFNSCIELKLIPEDAKYNSKEYRLETLRELIANHPGFEERTNLEILAEKYGIILLFLPKFHCELNPIESLWCSLKQYIRKRSDRTYEIMMKLLEEAKEEFNISNLNTKLWRRFWQAINMYDQKLPYAQIIQLLYGNRNEENKAHRKIYNSLL